jgi:hypothetical protein
VSRYDNRFSENQSPPPGQLAGYGAIGCAVGMVVGMFGCGLLLIVLAFISASRPVSAEAPGTAHPDLRLTVQEEFFSRFVQSATADVIQVDVMPGNRISVTMETMVSAFGQSLPIEVVPVFGLQAAGQALEVRLIDLQVKGVTLTPELEEVIAQNLPDINQRANQMLQNLSAALGMPIVITGLGTSDEEFWLEGRGAP